MANNHPTNHSQGEKSKLSFGKIRKNDRHKAWVKAHKSDLPLTSKGEPDQRFNHKGNQMTEHMERKNVISNDKRKEAKPLKTRQIVEGPIIVVFNDKNHTRFTARDAEHEKRIRKQYAYLEKDVVARVRASGRA